MKALPILVFFSLFCYSCGNNVPPSVWDHQNQEPDTAAEVQVKTPGEKLADRIDRGQDLFNINCTSCHNLFRDATGPPLIDILSKWRYDTAALNAFIRNPAKAINVAKMPRAVQSWEKFKPAMMTAFPALTNAQLNDIYNYLEYVPTSVP